MKKPNHNVYAYQCPQCGRLHYPAALRCKECGVRRYPEEDVELFWKKKEYKSWHKVPLEGECRLLSYTRLWALPVGFDQQYLDFGLVEFDNGLRASGQLLVDKPRMEMKVRATVGKIRDYPTHEEYGLQFVK